VRDLPAPVCFIQETSINKLFGMFGNRFEIAIQLFRDGVQRQIVFFAQQKKDVNPPVIGHALKVPLQLFACFCRFRHTKSLYHIANNIPTFRIKSSKI